LRVIAEYWPNSRFDGVSLFSALVLDETLTGALKKFGVVRN